MCKLDIKAAHASGSKLKHAYGGLTSSLAPTSDWSTGIFVSKIEKAGTVHNVKLRTTAQSEVKLAGGVTVFCTLVTCTS